MPLTMYVWETVATPSDPFGGFWKQVCVVFDNEAMGLLQRRFDGLNIKFVEYGKVRPEAKP